MCWKSGTPMRRPRLDLRAAALALAAVLCAGPALATPAAIRDAPADVATLLTRARNGLPKDCGTAPDMPVRDGLERVLCRRELRVGTRGDYPPFGETGPDGPRGFEPALARLLGARLGVAVRFAEVGAGDRMAALGDGRVDALIATTGHTLQRDAQALFVQPHYYASHTVVVGLRGGALQDVHALPALAGRTVCVTVGNATNADLALAGARLMLLASARRLVEQVRNGSCALAAHDDSLLLPLLPSAYEVKLAFAPLPWGIVVKRDDGALAQVLGLELQHLHADGTLLRLAQRYGVATAWLQAQQALWSAPPCDVPAALADARCVEAPRDIRLAPTRLADAADGLERWSRAHWGLELTLAMLKTQVAWRLFVQGIGWSLALVAGAVLCTVLMALGFGLGLNARTRWLRWPSWAVLLALQSTPMMLSMSVAGMALSAMGVATPAMAWLVAVAVLGMFNGSNAGQAMAEARTQLRAEGRPAGLGAAALRARAQIAAFAANATRGSPAASLIGVPELLAAQTDIASFSTASTTTFALLLLFYTALVSLVVVMLDAAQRRLQAREDGP